LAKLIGLHFRLNDALVGDLSARVVAAAVSADLVAEDMLGRRAVTAHTVRSRERIRTPWRRSLMLGLFMARDSRTRVREVQA
jgi:hypothetical protein